MKTQYKILLILFIIGLPFGLKAQDQTEMNITEKQTNLVENLVERFLQKANLPGLSIAVSKGGNIIYTDALGFADVNKEARMTVDTELRTASVAKVITATAIGKLLSDQKISLDDPICKYVSYLPKQYEDLTVRQLASHTAGVVHRPNGKKYKNKQFDTIKETVELIDEPLLFEPDTKYSYSTAGFSLLAAVIEGASGMTYEKYMMLEVFEPLQMDQTYPEDIKSLSEKAANLYYVGREKLKQEKLTSASYKLPGAGFRSTPSDLIRMMHGYNNDFLSANVVNEMFTSHQLKDGLKTNVGVVWRTSFDSFGNTVIEHAGSWKGARTVIVHFPEEQLSVAIMINADCQVFIEETAHLIAQVFRTQSLKSDNRKTKRSVEVLFQSLEVEKTYKGTFILTDGKGSLVTNSEGFLKSNELIYLGSKSDYALITRHGLMYLQLSEDAETIGELYLYDTRNEANPTEKEPIAVIR